MDEGLKQNTEEGRKQNIFDTVPEIADEVMEGIRKRFPVYLFYKMVSNGVREYSCTACGAVFLRGEKGTAEDGDRELYWVNHKGACRCPLCGADGTAINALRCKAEKYNDERFYAIGIPVSERHIWIRCFHIWRKFWGKLTGEFGTAEYFRYELKPGSAEMYESYNGFPADAKAERTVREPFIWNHGFYCDKKPYTVLFVENGGHRVEDSFLRYSAVDRYREASNYYDIPYIKYLCWYARHPQIEMLVKMGHIDLVEQMIYRNADYGSMVDWGAKTPQGLYRMDGQTYRAMVGKGMGKNFKLYQVFRKIGGRRAADAETAADVLSICNQVSRRTGGRWDEFIVRTRRQGGDIRKAASYFRRQKEKSGETVGSCYMTWLDYLDMSADAAAGTAFARYPKDLHAAHQALVVKLQTARAGLASEERHRRAEEIREAFPAVAAVCAEIRDIYEYHGEEYSVLVPNGIYDIMTEGEVLSHCVGEKERYYERIERRESYILFLRRNTEPDRSWYTIEAEPDGTIRQKRTYGDRQNDDLADAVRFLAVWQEEVARRLTGKERELAKQARVLRAAELDELRRIHARIGRGELQGRLLADVLEDDIMENRTENETEEYGEDERRDERNERIG